MAGDWSEEQNDAIVADYFAMLADDIAGRPYGKAKHDRLLEVLRRKADRLCARYSAPLHSHPPKRLCSS